MLVLTDQPSLDNSLSVVDPTDSIESIVDRVLSRNNVPLPIPETLPSHCKFCGCTEEDPCRLASGDSCGWLNFDRTVCTAPSCVSRLERPAKLPSYKRLADRLRRTSRFSKKGGSR